MGLTTKVLLNKSRQKNDGTYPLILRIIYNRKVINKPLGLSLFESEWDQSKQQVRSNSRIAGSVTRVNNKISHEVSFVYEAISKLEAVADEQRCHASIRKALLGEVPTEADFIQFIDQQITEYHELGKVGSLTVLSTLSRKLQQQHGTPIVKFTDITYAFLKQMEHTHYATGHGPGGLAVYMRTIRALYNKGIKAGLASVDSYPFKQYRIKSGQPERRALTEDQWEQFKSVDLKGQANLELARMYFLMSFYLRGMNWKDMCLMENSNIHGNMERVRYIRSKTGKPFSISVHPNLQPILAHLKKMSSTKYILPVLAGHESKMEANLIIREKRNWLNKKLKEIARICDLEKVSIYSARHTYATLGKRRGVPTAVLQESLGHKTEHITQTYLDSFENEVVDRYDAIIME